MNICIFGDSVAKGVVFDPIKNKYTFLKDNFINIAESMTANSFKNFAKFGCNIMKGAEILKKQEDKIKTYDYTILEFGNNDCDLNWNEVASAPKDSHLAQVPIDVFKEKYIEMIEKVRSLGSKPVLMNLQPLEPNKFFQWVSKDLDKNNILDFLGGSTEFIYKWQENYNDMIYDLARDEKVSIIDIRKDFVNANNYGELLCIDGMHPNEEGHRFIAKSFEKAIQNLS